MNVISRKKLVTFYLGRPERRQHAGAFNDWFKLARRADWRNFQDARATFGQTDTVTGRAGRTATVFDVGGNKYRIVAHVDYPRRTIKIEAVMDHKEYDKGLWKRLF